MRTDKKRIALTGDRPTGRLHLGHLAGSIKNRVQMQESYKLYLMLADIQALSAHTLSAAETRQSSIEIALDNISCGVDPKKTTFFVQSHVPAVAALSMLFMNLVTLSRLQRNPTIKTEMREKKFGQNVPIGFLAHPVSQAADILAFRAEVVPVGDDQLPLIEQANEIVQKFNSLYPADPPVFKKITAVTPKTAAARLPGIDGKGKASKSKGNVIFLTDTPETVKEKVMKMYTDPNHIHPEDPGRVEGNVVFTYLSVFAPDQKKVKDLMKRYEKGGLGDVEIKRYLIEVLENILAPIRQKRKEIEKDPHYIKRVLAEGTRKAQKVAQETLQQAYAAMQFNYF